MWQILFHQPEEKRALLVSDAWRAGYGLNSTETRILLRVPYNTAHIQLVKVGTLTPTQEVVRLYKSNEISFCRLRVLPFLQ